MDELERLKQIAQDLRGMREELVESNNASSLHNALDAYVSKADLYQCRDLVSMLIERVSDLQGTATELENAKDMLTNAIESEERIHENDVEKKLAYIEYLRDRARDEAAEKYFNGRS